MRTLFLGIFIAFFISCQKEGKFNLIRQLTFEDVSKEFGLDIVYTEPFKENLPNRFGSVETYKTFLSEKIAENKKLKNRKEYSRPSYSYYNILLCDPTSYLGGVRFYAPSEIILDSAIEYGLNMPYGCRCGFDVESIGFLIEGGVSYGQFTILEDDHIENGYALLDVAIPVSDCVIVYGEAVKEAYYDGYSYVDILGRGYNGKYSSKKINNE